MYSSVSTKTAPAKEPIEVAEARAWLRIDTEAEEDAVISGLITAARLQIENWTSRAMITQTLIWVTSESTPNAPRPGVDWPSYRGLVLPRTPVQSVSSVVQTDADGIATTLTTADYILDIASDPATLRFIAQPAGWLSNVKVEYVAGFGDEGADVPAPLRLAIKMLMAHLYEHRGDTAEEIPKAISIIIAPFALNYV